METYFNFLSKPILVFRLMQKVEARQGFPDKLEGSCKLHKEIYITLNMKLVGDIMMQLRRPETIMGVDEALCYHQIVHSVVILIDRHGGMEILLLLHLFGVMQQTT